MNTPSPFSNANKGAETHHFSQVTPDDCVSTNVLTQYSLPDSSSESESSPSTILPPTVKPKSKLKPMSYSEAIRMKRVKLTENKRKEAKLKIREKLDVSPTQRTMTQLLTKDFTEYVEC